jgi:hypothetical protein
MQPGSGQERVPTGRNHLTTTIDQQAAPRAAQGQIGKPRSWLGVIGLSIITLGIYGLVWTYKTFQEMKDYSGEGLGGIVGLVLSIIPFVSIATLFVLPSEVKNLYEREGREAPVTAATGCWVLLPFVGGLVWLFKVQGALSDFWRSKGA